LATPADRAGPKVEVDEVRIVLLPRNDLLKVPPSTPLGGACSRGDFARGRRRLAR
jgi:hypothetical protein